jgi:hypothetical protein
MPAGGLALPLSRPSIRLDAKKDRAFRPVRIFAEDGRLEDIARDAATLARYMRATNADVGRRHSGEIAYVRLRSLADDRGHSGETHGRSTKTTFTEMVEAGGGISHITQHKRLPHA